MAHCPSFFGWWFGSCLWTRCLFLPCAATANRQFNIIRKNCVDLRTTCNSGLWHVQLSCVGQNQEHCELTDAWSTFKVYEGQFCYMYSICYWTAKMARILQKYQSLEIQWRDLIRNIFSKYISSNGKVFFWWTETLTFLQNFYPTWNSKCFINQKRSEFQWYFWV